MIYIVNVLLFLFLDFISCFSFFCLNVVICINILGGFKCVCVLGWIGSVCEIGRVL